MHLDRVVISKASKIRRYLAIAHLLWFRKWDFSEQDVPCMRVDVSVTMLIYSIGGCIIYTNHHWSRPAAAGGTGTILSVSQCGRTVALVTPRLVFVVWKILFGGTSTEEYRVCLVREKVTVARFSFIWQLLSNYEVISLKGFVSLFTTKLCN